MHDPNFVSTSTLATDILGSLGGLAQEALTHCTVNLVQDVDETTLLVAWHGPIAFTPLLYLQLAEIAQGFQRRLGPVQVYLHHGDVDDVLHWTGDRLLEIVHQWYPNVN
jgi:hypothetical protein